MLEETWSKKRQDSIFLFLFDFFAFFRLFPVSPVFRLFSLSWRILFCCLVVTPPPRCLRACKLYAYSRLCVFFFLLFLLFYFIFLLFLPFLYFDWTPICFILSSSWVPLCCLLGFCCDSFSKSRRVFRLVDLKNHWVNSP